MLCIFIQLFIWYSYSSNLLDNVPKDLIQVDEYRSGDSFKPETQCTVECTRSFKESERQMISDKKDVSTDCNLCETPLESKRSDGKITQILHKFGSEDEDITLLIGIHSPASDSNVKSITEKAKVTEGSYFKSTESGNQNRDGNFAELHEIKSLVTDFDGLDICDYNLVEDLPHVIPLDDEYTHLNEDTCVAKDPALVLSQPGNSDNSFASNVLQEDLVEPPIIPIRHFYHCPCCCKKFFGNKSTDGKQY